MKSGTWSEQQRWKFPLRGRRQPLSKLHPGKKERKKKFSLSLQLISFLRRLQAQTGDGGVRMGGGGGDETYNSISCGSEQGSEESLSEASEENGDYIAQFP